MTREFIKLMSETATLIIKLKKFKLNLIKPMKLTNCTFNASSSRWVQPRKQLSGNIKKDKLNWDQKLKASGRIVKRIYQNAHQSEVVEGQWGRQQIYRNHSKRPIDNNICNENIIKRSKLWIFVWDNSCSLLLLLHKEFIIVLLKEHWVKAYFLKQPYWSWGKHFFERC